MKENETILNEAGGFAYKNSAQQSLALYSATGCLSNIFYASAETQTKTILDLCDKTSPEFVAKVAVYAREKGHMKEVPALLTSWLAAKHHNELFTKVFHKVIDNGKMLRSFIKHMRSNVTGRKCLGTLPKRNVINWFNSRTDNEIFSQSVGNDPSFRAIIKLAHPKPLSKTRNSLYAYLMDKEFVFDDLPEIVKFFERYKKGQRNEVPEVPFEMLTALELGQSEWAQIALKAGWHWTRMNLNTLKRHNVFDMEGMVDHVVSKLVDKKAIKNSRVFPYQLMVAYKNAVDIPHPVKEALQDALEIATENVPQFKGNGHVLIDVSGSMSSPVTGSHGKVDTKVTCVDVAGLLASVILRNNPTANIVPFADSVKKVDLNSRDTVLTNADKLSKMLGGGTNCAAPLRYLNDKGVSGDWVFLISDNQSWIASRDIRGKTVFSIEWEKYRIRNPNAKLICLDIAPYSTSQSETNKDVLHCGGMSDTIFTIVNGFLNNELEPDYWVSVIEKMEI